MSSCCRSERTAVIWGAGKIGRGFAGDLLHAAGYRLVFVDNSQALVEALRQAGRYTVVRSESATQRTDAAIDGYTALCTDDAEQVAAAVAAADLLAVAVFPQAFAEVAQQLAPGLRRRRAPLDILLLTNLPHAGPHFGAFLRAALPLEAQSLMDSSLGIVETLVIRMAAEAPREEREREPLLVWTNGYPELFADRYAFRGPLPLVPGLRLVEDMRAEERRKLYTYNLFHAALAYLGALRGHTRSVECLADAEVRAVAEGALAESSRALQAGCGFTAREMQHWTEGVLRQTANPTLGDTVRRMGADPRRKLGREDRLVAPALLARAHGLQTERLSLAIAAGLRYQDPTDPGAVYVQARIAALGMPAAVYEVCGLSAAEEDLVVAIARAYAREVRASGN